MSPSEVDSSGVRGTNEGSKLAGNATFWDDGDLKINSAFGESGFSALPAGFRNRLYGEFQLLLYGTYFWSSTEESDYSWCRLLYFDFSEVFRISSLKPNGFSVRLVKD